MEFNTLRVPRALDNVEPLVLDMTVVRLAIARIESGEMGSLTPSRAQEAMAFFNNAYLAASQHAVKLRFELDLAQQRLGQIKSVLMLDKIPEILRAKGLATEKNPLGSESLRQAVIDGDPEYQRVSFIHSVIKTRLQWLVDLKDSFEQAYTGAKKVLGDTGTFHSRPNSNLTTTGIQPINSTPDDRPTFKNDGDVTDNDFFGETR